MNLRGVRVLVTGANGNVGSAVAARLAREECGVRGLVRGTNGSAVGDTVRGDLGDRAALATAARGIDLCVHCAAERSGDADACRRSNVEGVANLIEALSAAGCQRLIHLSTVSVYDDAAGPDFDENSPLWSGNGDPYGDSKATSERLIAGARGLGAVILRPALVTSMHPRSKWGPLAIARASATADSILPFSALPHVHVDNLAEAVLLAAQAPETLVRGKAYNVVDGVGRGRDYLDAVYGAIGRPTPPIPPDAPALRYSAQRIRDELGYAPVDRWPEFLTALRDYRPRTIPSDPLAPVRRGEGKRLR